MNRITWISVLLMLLLFGMSGCAKIDPPAPHLSSSVSSRVPWKARETALNRITSWQINGKIAVKTPKESGTASFNWMQNRNRYFISLIGPLGSGGFKLTGQPRFVTLQLANGKTYTASNAQDLLAAQWGYNLPVANLNYWIRGLPSPDSPYNAQFDSYHRLTFLIQKNWRVQFLAYQRVGAMELPNKIFIYSPSLNVKIIIYQWQAFSH